MKSSAVGGRPLDEHERWSGVGLSENEVDHDARYVVARSLEGLGSQRIDVVDVGNKQHAMGQSEQQATSRGNSEARGERHSELVAESAMSITSRSTVSAVQSSPDPLDFARFTSVSAASHADATLATCTQVSAPIQS